jgi:hypothetical protein
MSNCGTGDVARVGNEPGPDTARRDHDYRPVDGRPGALAGSSRRKRAIVMNAPKAIHGNPG